MFAIKMKRISSFVLGGLIFFLLQQNSIASIIPIKSQISYSHYENVFASDKGPFFAKKGNSSFQVVVKGVNVTPAMNSWTMNVFFFHADSVATLAFMRQRIAQQPCTLDVTKKHVGISHLSVFNFSVQNVQVNYHIKKKGWTNVQMFTCTKMAQLGKLTFEGKLTVENPYGYLPATLFGLLPFSAFTLLGYVVFDLYFFILFCKYRDQVVRLQYGILVVLTMGTLASGTWFYAFYAMNINGKPPCCPFPTEYMVSVLLDTAMRTCARVLLLTVCLGYGVVRSQLGHQERVFIMLLSVVYFIGSAADALLVGTSDGKHKISTAHGHGTLVHPPSYWSFVELISNLIFIMWIYQSLENITKELANQKQTVKLRMYQSLSWTLAGFIIFFGLLTMVIVGSRFELFHFPAEWEWTQLVVWPVLNFTVSSSICYIWRPCATSSQYALSTQLPMSEDAFTYGDDSDENDFDSVSIEMTNVQKTQDELKIDKEDTTGFSLDSEDENDEHEDEEEEGTFANTPFSNDSKERPVEIKVEPKEKGD